MNIPHDSAAVHSSRSRQAYASSVDIVGEASEREPFQKLVESISENLDAILNSLVHGLSKPSTCLLASMQTLEQSQGRASKLEPL